jgi:NDP-sugar pyrophosphorylase family protein
MSSDASWVSKYFPGIDPYLLKIVNKPLLEYYVDFAAMIKAQEVRIVSEESIKDIEGWFSNGEKWGLNISYALARPEDSINQVYLKNLSFCREDDLIILQGYNFIDYDKNTIADCRMTSLEQGSYLNNELILLKQGTTINKAQAMSMPADAHFSIIKIGSVQDYYQLSMDILAHKNRQFVLPGYSNENDAFYGTNFIFPHTSKVIKPIIIGNNARFQKYTVLGSNAIIGDNVIIDEGSTVQDSIIYDDTYIGSELELNQKIVFKSNLISGINGECIHIEEKFLMAQVDKGIFLSYFDRILQLVLAVFIIVIQFVPWLLISGLAGLLISKPRRKSEFYLSKSLHAKQLDDPDKLRKHLLGRLMLRLSLDKFPLLIMVIKSRLILVGNHVLSTTQQHRMLINDLPLYQPGVFSLVESVGKKQDSVEEFYEREFLDTRCWRTNIKILVLVIYRRLIYGY